MNTENSVENSGTPVAVANPLVFMTTYNFRTIAPAKWPEFIDNIDTADKERVTAEFDVIKEGEGEAAKVKGYKRKPVTVSLLAPEFILALPSELAKDVIKGYVTDFVKNQYIENFAPVGEHDWATIEKVLSEVTRRGGALHIDISDDEWKECSASFARFMGQAVKNEQAGERLGSTMLAKFSKPAIFKNVGEMNATIVDKLQTRLDSWAEYVTANEPEVITSAANVYDVCSARLKKYKAETSVNVVELL